MDENNNQQQGTENAISMNDLSLGNIIGGVLTSIIEGQSQALDNVLDFIQRLSPTGDAEKDKGRYIIVAYDSQNIDDPSKNDTVQMKVPLISLLPIPYLAITEVDIDFDYKIHSTQEDKHAIDHTPAARLSNSPVQSQGDTQVQEVCGCSFKGSIAPSSRLKQNRKTVMAAQISIKMKMREQNFGEGMNEIYQAGQAGIQKEILPPPEEE